MGGDLIKKRREIFVFIVIVLFISILFAVSANGNESDMIINIAVAARRK